MRTTLTTKLPSINSNKFKELHYKEQLYILNLYLHDRDKYLELVGSTPKELEYIDKEVSALFRVSSRPENDDETPVSFVENCWCAYLARFNPKWWDEDFSPIEDLGLSHQRIFGIQLFNFPLVSFDRPSSHILRWLVKEPKKTRKLNDVFYYLIKLRAAYQYFSDELQPNPKPLDIWNLSVIYLNDYPSVAEINGLYPIIEDNDLIELIEDDVLAPLTSQVRCLDGRSYIPLVPAELYCKLQFKIRGWDFLVRK